MTLTITGSVDSAIALGSPNFAVTSGCNCLEETPEIIFNTTRHCCGYVWGRRSQSCHWRCHRSLCWSLQPRRRRSPEANAFCQWLTFLWARQPQLTQHGGRNYRQRVQSAPHSLDMMSLQPKLVPPRSHSAWSQDNPECRQIRMQLALQKANQQPNKKSPWSGGCLPPQLQCHLPCPSPGCVLERATADYHHASHMRGMCWKQHYSSQPPTAPCLKLKARSNP